MEIATLLMEFVAVIIWYDDYFEIFHFIFFIIVEWG